VLGVLKLYADTAVLAGRRAVRAWPVAFSLVLYTAILMVTGRLVAPVGGAAAGFVVGLVLAACLSSYLHLVSHVVGGVRLRWADLGKSFGARFWDVMSVLFVFWIASFASPIVESFLASITGDRAFILMKLLGVAVAVFFNPVPELIYQGTSRSVQLLVDSARFVSRHGLEWLVPNVIFMLALLAPLGLLHGPPGEVVLNMTAIFSPTSQGLGLLSVFQRASLPLELGLLLFGHWVMVFRGLLLKELMAGGARQRALRDVWRR